ncbi:MAG: hypothetical protein A3F26_01380 [Candidatus Ryanbacteria bacterium RIFCSPHIGHO2_12_FULL_47_12b]|nr:MAG: hypothetical protein UX74_C0044G0006 [Parcubacteria group bacterium GW2011_GWA2_47_10b]OGZ52561.1 MAG: hypothetical protein A3F26_01380 [Candidatus Ryanbacteria bacterium RIFCSPHIGHO2_12_FULL_47_12b]
MSKIIFGIIIVILIAGGVFYLFNKQPVETSIDNGAMMEKKDGATMPVPGEPVTDGEMMTQSATVDISDDGFSPETLKIKAGTTIMFRNKSSRESWPASAVHPEHKVYPDQDSCFAGKFTGCGIPSGGEWSYTFQQKGSWKYHDHKLPTLRGTIIAE